MLYTKEQIEEANGKDIVKVAEDLNMTIKRQGRTVMALCPWHEDATPSLQLGGRDGYRSQCRCYVCEKSWGVVSLVMAVKGCNFKEAMEWLVGHDPTPNPSRGRGDTFGQRKWAEAKCDKKRLPESQMGASPICHGRYAKMSDLGRFVSLQNALAKCLMYRFPKEVVTRVTYDYLLGVDYDVCHYDHTLFPSIDIEGRVHNVKAQGYVTCPTHERFGHSTKGQTYWVGQRLLPGQDHDTQCLFGEHLLRRYPNRVVVLVESPKNAVVGACRYPDLLWLATGNKGMLKRELLEVLRGRKVIVIPDRDAIDEWRQKIQGMQDIATLQLSTFCQCQEDEANRKMDIADLILSK